MYIKISFKVFLVVSLIIFSIPVITKVGFVLKSEKTKGVAIRKAIIQSDNNRFQRVRSFKGRRGGLTYTVTLFEYKVGESTYNLKGPYKIIFERGTELTICYDPKDPRKSFLLHFLSFYSFTRSIIPFLLFITWVALYTSFKPPKSKKGEKYLIYDPLTGTEKFEEIK